MAGMMGRRGGARDMGGLPAPLFAATSILRGLPGRAGEAGQMITDRVNAVRGSVAGAGDKAPLTMLGDVVRAGMGRRRGNY